MPVTKSLRKAFIKYGPGYEPGFFGIVGTGVCALSAAFAAGTAIAHDPGDMARPNTDTAAQVQVLESKRDAYSARYVSSEDARTKMETMQVLSTQNMPDIAAYQQSITAATTTYAQAMAEAEVARMELRSEILSTGLSERTVFDVMVAAEKGSIGDDAVPAGLTYRDECRAQSTTATEATSCMVDSVSNNNGLAALGGFAGLFGGGIGFLVAFAMVGTVRERMEDKDSRERARIREEELAQTRARAQAEKKKDPVTKSITLR